MKEKTYSSRPSPHPQNLLVKFHIIPVRPSHSKAPRKASTECENCRIAMPTSLEGSTPSMGSMANDHLKLETQLFSDPASDCGFHPRRLRTTREGDQDSAQQRVTFWFFQLVCLGLRLTCLAGCWWVLRHANVFNPLFHMHPTESVSCVLHHGFKQNYSTYLCVMCWGGFNISVNMCQPTSPTWPFCQLCFKKAMHDAYHDRSQLLKHGQAWIHMGKWCKMYENVQNPNAGGNAAAMVFSQPPQPHKGLLLAKHSCIQM